MDLPEPLSWSLAVLAGVLAGFVNTLAGSGSFLTLPALLLLGLDTDVANGTNRVGILLASITGVLTLRARGGAAPTLSTSQLLWIVLPASLGAVLGAQIALEIDEALLDRVVAVLMLLMLALVLLRPERWIVPAGEAPRSAARPAAVLWLVLIGAYGGFIQAGVGIFLLAALVLDLRFGLREANRLKLIVVLTFTLPALGVFAWSGRVHWGYGTLLALGQMAGAFAAGRLAARPAGADRSIRALLVVVLLASALHLGVQSLGR